MTSIALTLTSLLAAILPTVFFRAYDPVVLLSLLTLGAGMFTIVSDYLRSVRHEWL